jgi:Na+/melibiose symporter-like transporter
MINIPYTAWGAELSSDYDERSRIVTYRSVIGAVGGVLFLAAPLLLPFETTEMSAEVLDVVAWVAIALMPVVIAITVLGTPTTRSAASQRGSLRTLLPSIRHNGPFLRYLAAFVLGAIQLGFYATLLFLFVDSYLGIGDKFSYVMAATAFVGWVSMPLWLKISKRWGKHRPWAFSWAASAAVLFCFLFVEPGPDSFVPTLVISCVYGLLGACSAVTPPSILADVIDYDILKTGEDRAGNYFAFHLLVVKVAVAVSGGLAFLLLDLFGYDAQSPVQDSTARFGMLFSFVLLPNLLQVLSALVVWNFPLDERRQRTIRRRLRQRAERALRDGTVAAVP